MFVGIATAVAVTGRAYGGYEVGVWAPLGLLLAATAAALAVGGHRPRGLVALAAAALVALGVWSALSPAWGGLPDEAWTFLNQSLIAAAALVVGSLLAANHERTALLLGAVLTGLTAQAVEVLVRLATDSYPDRWLYGRLIEGPVGHHTAQGTLFALGVPLAVWAAASRLRRVRMLGGAAAGTLLAAVLLTQSRGAVIAVGVALVAQLAFARSARLVLFVAPLAVAAAGLGLALGDVDAALLAESAAGRIDAFREYALWAALASLALTLAAAPELRSPLLTRRLAAGVGVLLVLVAVWFAFPGRGSVDRAATSLSQSTRELVPRGAAGRTRLGSLSFNGRKDLWRVARELAADSPLTGAGEGQFARYWTIERRLATLYVLQPLNIELELLSELGIVGFALFAAFLVLAVLALATRRRPEAAAAFAVLLTLVLQASVDFTWSFSGIVAPALLVVGAVAGAGRRGPLSLVTKTVLAAVAVVLLCSFAAPYLAHRQLDRGRSLEQTDVTGAWDRAQAARKLNPWNPSALELQGRLAESTGAFRLAATRYREAAELSRRPWLAHFNEARALRRAGAPSARRAACLRAAKLNPGEQLLLTGPCSYSRAGNRWPVVPARASRADRRVYGAFFKDEACTRCRVRVVRSQLAASVAGGADSLDSAYAVRDFGGPRGVGGRIFTRDVIRLARGQELKGNLVLLEVRDVRERLVFDVYLRRDRTIRFHSPEGGLHVDDLNFSTEVEVPNDGVSTRRIEVSALRNDSFFVRVDGEERIRLDHSGAVVAGRPIRPSARGLSGATTGNPRFVRAGIPHYDVWTTFDPVTVYHSGVTVTREAWPGAFRPRRR